MFKLQLVFVFLFSWLWTWAYILQASMNWMYSNCEWGVPLSWERQNEMKWNGSDFVLLFHLFCFSHHMIWCLYLEYMLINMLVVILSFNTWMWSQNVPLVCYVLLWLCLRIHLHLVSREYEVKISKSQHSCMSSCMGTWSSVKLRLGCHIFCDINN